MGVAARTVAAACLGAPPLLSVPTVGAQTRVLPLATAERPDGASGPHIRTGLQIMDFAMLHEVLHTMGFVPTCAAHHTRSGHVFDNPRDIMFVGDGPWRPAILDVGQDDYYHAGRGEDDPGERASRPRTR